MFITIPSPVAAICICFFVCLFRIFVCLFHSQLVYDDDTRKEPTIIPLHEIEGIKLTSLKAFEISSEDGKSFCFEASDSTVQKMWVEALKYAIQKARHPPLSEQIEIERRQKLDMKKREEYQAQRSNIIASARKDGKNTRGKYGLA